MNNEEVKEFFTNSSDVAKAIEENLTFDANWTIADVTGFVRQHACSSKTVVTTVRLDSLTKKDQNSVVAKVCRRLVKEGKLCFGDDANGVNKNRFSGC